jgi:hypothetical protein
MASTKLSAGTIILTPDVVKLDLPVHDLPN